MHLASRMVPLAACAALLLIANVALACDGGATACCARAAKTTTAIATPAPAPAPAPAVATLPGLPSLMPAPVSPAIVSGLRAFIDPETGELSSTLGLVAPEDIFAPVVDVANLPQIAMPDGSFMIDTRGILMDDFVVQVNALGHRTFRCMERGQHTAAPSLLPAPTPYAER